MHKTAVGNHQGPLPYLERNSSLSQTPNFIQSEPVTNHREDAKWQKLLDC